MSAVRPAVPDGARLVLATHNHGKLAELQTILQQALGDQVLPHQIVCAADVQVDPPREDGVTFAQNALIKARAVVAATGLPAVSDDSGLTVDVLGGAPGVFSARWAGRHGDDMANMRLLLDQLADVPSEHRGAAFRCAAAWVTPDGVECVAEGELRGTLLHEPIGDGGFGYDPILQPRGLTQSCAQLPPEHKNAISHRGQAFRALAVAIGEYLRSERI